MNRKRIEHAIEVMQGAQSLAMKCYQTCVVGANVAHTIEELHACGNSACFWGYMRLTPECSKWYENVETSFMCGPDECAAYLEISRAQAIGLVYGDVWRAHPEGGYHITRDYYPVPFGEVKPEHVIAKLQLILESGDETNPTVA